jgi:hypothetical protein
MCPEGAFQALLFRAYTDGGDDAPDCGGGYIGNKTRLIDDQQAPKLFHEGKNGNAQRSTRSRFALASALYLFLNHRPRAQAQARRHLSSGVQRLVRRKRRRNLRA